MTRRTHLRSFVRAWLASRVGISRSTSERYRHALAPLLEAFGRRELRTVGPLELQAWVSDLCGKLMPGTVRLAGKLCRMVFRDTVLGGLLSRSPADSLRLPSAPSRARLLTVTYREARGALDGCRRVGGPYLETLSLLLESGLRLGELLSLRWVDVREDSLHIRPHEDGWAPKAGARVVPLSRRGLRDVAALRLCGGRGAPLVVRRTCSERAQGTRLRLGLGWACLDFDLPRIRLHDLRHLFGTHLFEVGSAAPIVQALLGHSSLAMTQLYAHVAPEGLRAAMGRF